MASTAFSTLLTQAAQEEQLPPEVVEQRRQEQLALAPPSPTFTRQPSLTGTVAPSTLTQAGTQSLGTILEGQDIGGVEPGQGASFLGITPSEFRDVGVTALSTALAPVTFGGSALVGAGLLQGQQEQAADTVGGSARENIFTIRDPEGNILPPDTVIPNAVVNEDGTTSPGIVNPDGTVSPGIVNPDGTISPAGGTVDPNTGEVVRDGGGGPGLDVAGQRALQEQMALLGLSGQQAGEEAMTRFTESPGQKFLRDQQERALLRNASAIGGLGGGNIRTALQEQAFGRGQTQLQNRLGQLGAISGRGLQQQQLGLQEQGMSDAQAMFDEIQRTQGQQAANQFLTNLVEQSVAGYTQYANQPQAQPVTQTGGFVTTPQTTQPPLSISGGQGLTVNQEYLQ
jgi:hypothetical protein